MCSIYKELISANDQHDEIEDQTLSCKLPSYIKTASDGTRKWLG